MSTRKVFHCVVDDTALIANISEIKNWISSGAITLVVPLYTLERLHVLKKDLSQIGINAREAVKFLDRVTSGKDGLPIESIVLQGPDEQYATWAQVETHYVADSGAPPKEDGIAPTTNGGHNTVEVTTPMANGSRISRVTEVAGGALSQLLLDKLNFAQDPSAASPFSTPPTSPTSSGQRSSKTSPEVSSATMTTHDVSATPHALKPLLNSVVWYTYEHKGIPEEPDTLFLTNAGETANLARSFGITPKNIHQLRSSINLEEQEIKNQDKYQQKYPSPPQTEMAEAEPKALFKYEEDSEEEEVVFKPRGRGARASKSTRASPTTSLRGRGGFRRSPVPKFSTPSPVTNSKPQVPIEEIDPDSFDRGSFGRGSVPLANTGRNHTGQSQDSPRGQSSRGGFAPTGPARGGFYRGSARGFDRGSSRGRGRLFVP